MQCMADKPHEYCTSIIFEAVTDKFKVSGVWPSQDGRGLAVKDEVRHHGVGLAAKGFVRDRKRRNTDR